MAPLTRRQLLRSLAAAPLAAQVPGERPGREPGVEVLNPRDRVPVSLIIDDSTCLVNLNKFSIPQFALARPGLNYDTLPWRSMPREIPDDFVRRFVDWAGENGVRGKYSIVPFPACVGRLDRTLPGWPRKQVDESIRLVRERVTPAWDIHPEMITHTWVIDLKTGHPYAERNERFVENWRWSDNRSVDELAAYLSYALRILHNVDLPCEGVTTPGGFGTGALPQLSQATLEACRDVYQAEIPHYFRHLIREGDQSVEPRVEYASGLGGDDPKCCVSIIGCTADWSGGWDCSNRGDLDRFITPDLSSGRMVEVIDRGEPAVMVCHWTGIYFNGEEVGLKIYQEVVRRLHAKYDNLIWMKNSELARYWAARELTKFRREGAELRIEAPFACPDFTLRLSRGKSAPPRFAGMPLREVGSARALKAGTWAVQGESILACVDMPKGASILS